MNALGRCRRLISPGVGIVLGWATLASQGCFSPLDVSDLDHDSYTYNWITDNECAPDDKDVHPGQVDQHNEVDDDCDGRIDNPADRDHDGWTEDIDCDDTNATVHPGAPEIIDGQQIDENCDGLTDACDSYSDCDGDGVSLVEGDCRDGDPVVGGTESKACKTGVPGACTDGHWTCVGADAVCAPDTGPSEETCNGRDDDCDGLSDEDIVGTGVECAVTSALGQCAKGRLECIGSQYECLQLFMPETEACNGRDDDCDGQTDEPPCPCQSGETQPCGTTDMGECQRGIQTCDNGNWGPCVGNIEPTAENCHDGQNRDSNCRGEPRDEDDSECVTTVNLPSPLLLFPLNLINGDNEFNGHGPDVNVKLYLSRDPSYVYVNACVRMTETVSDCTTGNLTCGRVKSVYAPNAGFLATEDTFFEVNYRDFDHSFDDAIPKAKAQQTYTSDCNAPRTGGYYNPAGFVAAVTCIGDTDGGDVCSNVPWLQGECTGCSADLGSVKVWRK